MRFARWVFRGAGVYGVVVIAPMFFLERRISSLGLPIAHPELYYGFAGAVFAWQLLFLVVSTDPARYRPLMPVAVLEKAAYAIAVPILVAQGRVMPALLPFAGIDAILGILFIAAFLATRPPGAPA